MEEHSNLFNLKSELLLCPALHLAAANELFFPSSVFLPIPELLLEDL